LRFRASARLVGPRTTRPVTAPVVAAVGTLSSRLRFLSSSSHHDPAPASGSGNLKPRLQSWEDKQPYGPEWQESPTDQIGAGSGEQKWNSILRQHLRVYPFPFTDSRNQNWHREIPDFPTPKDRPSFPPGYFPSAKSIVLMISVAGVIAFIVWREKKKPPAWMEGQEKSGLDPQKFVPFKVREIKPYNHNTKIIVLELQSANVKPELPITSFVLSKHPDAKDKEGKPIMRPYTPIDQYVKGELHLMIKKYENGIMSGYFHSLKPGDRVEIKGPIQKLKYQPNMKKQIGLLAGGTGITPCLQLIDEVLSNPKDNTQMTLIYANVSIDDILLKSRLDGLAAKYPKKLKVHYAIDSAPPSWKGHVGYITEDLIKKYMPPPSKDNIVMVCGPPPMMKAISGDKVQSPTGAYEQGPVEGLLKKLNYTPDNVFKF